MPFGGPTHERMAPVDDESPQTTSSGDVWAQTQHGTCNSSAHATGFDRALTYSPPFVVRAHQTTKEDCTPGTLKASQVALVEPVAYLKDLVNNLIACIPESSATINMRDSTRRQMFDPRARRVYHAECSRVCSADLPDHVRKPSKYDIGHQTYTRCDEIRCRVMTECLWRSTHAE